jgi:peptidoglycan hydrolase-like protein with peptidoglycan-binding domain
MSSISSSVGKGGVNQHHDVQTVQTLLNDNLRKLAPLNELNVDGISGPNTLAAITAFQGRVVGMPQPDGRVDPHGPTLKALLRCGCDNPIENFPYTDDTFSLIGRLADMIKVYSKLMGVPPIAVAGSIADEYNTMKGIRSAVDWFQDNVLLHFMPNFAIEIDAWVGFNTKFLNATKHDLGIGNIKLETARQVYEQFKSTFDSKKMNYADLVEYLRSDKGTVHVASLVIKKASQDLADLVKGYSPEKTEAVYVTYYKQGPSYIQRFKAGHASGSHRRIEPGEGCRVLLQRGRFLSVLGLK